MPGVGRLRQLDGSESGHEPLNPQTLGLRPNARWPRRGWIRGCSLLRSELPYGLKRLGALRAQFTNRAAEALEFCGTRPMLVCAIFLARWGTPACTVHSANLPAIDGRRSARMTAAL